MEYDRKAMIDKTFQKGYLRGILELFLTTYLSDKCFYYIKGSLPFHNVTCAASPVSGGAPGLCMKEEKMKMLIDEVRFQLRDGREALLRSPKAEDAESTLEYLAVSAGETEFILLYPEEVKNYTPESEKKFLEQKLESPNEAMIMCIVDGRVVGDCTLTFFTGIKTKHRASIGIAIISEFWNQGIGTKMFEEMIRLAESREDVMQLELDFIEGNVRARHLYEKMGFRTIGVRPNAIRLKDGTLLNEYMMIRDVKR